MNKLTLMLTAALAVALVVTTACTRELDESITSLEPGDCILAPEDLTRVDEAEHVECSESGALKATSVVQVTGYDEYPGVEEIESMAAARCSASSVLSLYPTSESWKAGDREIVCFSD